MCVPGFIVIGYCVSELHGRYCNILPEAVYCCYTSLPNFLHVYVIREFEVAIISPSFVTLYLMVSEIQRS